MGLFRRDRGGHSSGGLPSDVAQTLERYGRWARDPEGSGIDVASVGIEHLQQPFINAIVAGGNDLGALTDRMCRELLNATRGQSGWALYGAYKLVEDMAGDVDPPAKVELRLAGMGFLREAGVPWNTHLSPREMQFWIDQTGTGAQDWLPWRDPPTRASAPAEPTEGELRHIATTKRPDGENRIHVRRGTDGVEAVILYSDSDFEFVWYTEPTAYDLFLRVGGAMAVPPDWMAEELEPYIPQRSIDFEAAAEAHRRR